MAQMYLKKLIREEIQMISESFDLSTRNSLKDLKNRYINSPLRDDNKLKRMKSSDVLEMSAFIWQLDTGRFEATGFSTNGIVNYLSVGRTSDIINAVANVGVNPIKKYFLNKNENH